MLWLRQSTASQEVPLGYFVDSTDGNSEETGLTIANTDIKVWKTGATTLANKNSGGATHISNGLYYAVLDATDTNTIGPLTVFVHVAGALSVRLECCVLDEAVYDVVFGTTALSTYAGGAVASVTGAVGSVTGAVGSVTGAVGSVTAGVTLAANAITAAATAADFTTEIQAGLATAAELAKVPKSDGTATWNATALASLQAEATDALTAYDPPTRAELSSDVATLATAANLATVAGYLDTEIAAILADTNELQTDWANGGRLDLILDAASAPSAAAVADAVWDEALAGHVGAGSAGEALGAAGTAGDPWTTAIPGAYGAGTAGNVLGNRLVGTIATGTHNPQSGDAFARLGAPAGASVSADVASVKSETAAILVDTGTTLQAELDGIQADTEDIQSRLPAALVVGRIDASVGAMAANVMTAAAAAADLTTEFQSGIATSANLATLQTSVDDVPTNAELSTAIAAGDDAVLAAVAALTVPTANQNADAMLDLVDGIETGLTPRGALRLMASSIVGKLSGAETSTVTIRNVGDSKNRITATVDANGNRTSVTTDAT